MLSALRIILQPAKKPLIQIFASIAFAIALPIAVLGFFAHAGRDPNRLRSTIAGMQLRDIKEAVEKFRADCGRYPTTQEGLDTLVSTGSLTCSKAPYLESVPLDPWRHPYWYAASNGSMDIRSLGADGKPGGQFFDTDLSTKAANYVIPTTPSEQRRSNQLLAYWLTAILTLAGSTYALNYASRLKPAEPRDSTTRRSPESESSLHHRPPAPTPRPQ